MTKWLNLRDAIRLSILEAPYPAAPRNDEGKTCAGEVTADRLPAKKRKTSEKLAKLGTTCFFSPCGLLS